MVELLLYGLAGLTVAALLGLALLVWAAWQVGLGLGEGCSGPDWDFDWDEVRR